MSELYNTLIGDNKPVNSPSTNSPQRRGILAESYSVEVLAKMKLKQAVSDASEAFWAVIAAEYNECETGDFPPDATFDWDNACEHAVAVWVEMNDPESEFNRPDITESVIGGSPERERSSLDQLI